ncbi:type II secretion system minor pseudopilin GspK [Verminephrobacter eiseniae]|uniref:type II secretion system minor pseudopilin GspK n=1 Tax=Verminephrobacter eiseniae TaxID=364317 RepID=UPI00223718B3|nr:type II secretion system minor pseudopilin GspK [Verminephrobacter eiseniae]
MRPPGLRASPGLRRRARGAALLLAMLTVTLVATFAAAAMWQQWRAVEIESAERARVQSAWILVGALDWSRLILFEDKRSDDGTDHLAEPWAVPLQEARLSTFLAADRNVTQMQDASTDTTEAFLSGAVSDLQGRLNIGNLFQGGRVQPLAQRQFGRLFARLGLSDQQLNLLVDGMREAQAGAGGEGSTAPLLPPGVTQLGWLGLTPATVAALAPHVALLPVPTPVNINTADTEVLLAAIDDLDSASAQKIVQTREAKHFRTLDDVRKLLAGSGVNLGDDNAYSVNSSWFEVHGRLRLNDTVVDERSLLRRDGRLVTTIWRERGALAREPSGAAPEARR